MCRCVVLCGVVVVWVVEKVLYDLGAKGCFAGLEHRAGEHWCRVLLAYIRLFMSFML